MANVFYIWNSDEGRFDQVTMSLATSMGNETWTETDAHSGLPIENVDVSICADAGGSDIVVQGITDENGQVTFNLPTGQTYYAFRRKDGYRFDNPVVVNT